MLCGCAFYYHDTETNTQHVYGFGHMAVRVTPSKEEVQAVITQQQFLGISAGSAQGKGGFCLGWCKQQELSACKESVSLRVEWNDSSLLRTNVGSKPPKNHSTPETRKSENPDEDPK